MEYMLLLYADESLASKVPREELAKVFADFGAVTGDLQRKNQLHHTSPLQPTRSATTVRVRDGKRTLQDGPFAETKEQLGGYYVIDVPSLDDAIAVAERIPTVRYGSIEIRPLMKMG
jgi:hypothetical protein